VAGQRQGPIGKAASPESLRGWRRNTFYTKETKETKKFVMHTRQNPATDLG